MNDEAMPVDSDSRAASRSTNRPPLRVWPALFLVALLLITRFLPAFLEGGFSRHWMIAMIGPIVCSLLLVIWWLAASRATLKERLLGFLGLLACFAATIALVEPMMRGPGTVYVTLPMGLVAFVVGTALYRAREPLTRTSRGVLFAAVGFGFSCLLRNEGMDGEYQLTLRSRWSSSPEKQWAVATATSAAAPSVALGTHQIQTAILPPDWPGFRGSDSSGRWLGPAIATNWSERPPRQLWRIPVGPGWSSFAVAGRRLFTQEQRGPMEAVVCYDAKTGAAVWKREFATRFDDPMGGPGPRGTPTLAEGALFTMGATGLLCRLNPLTGEVHWQKDLREIAGRIPPMWGFSGSPLVVSSNVIVWAGGKDGKGVLAFDTESGAVRWSAPSGNDSYASPQRTLLGGAEGVLMLCNEGLSLLDPSTGQVRLRHEWKISGYRALQPTVANADTVLFGSPMNAGTRAIRITESGGKLVSEELWTSRHLKPDFSDAVAYQEHVYGNDAGLLTCLDVKTGERKWKGGRYGKGQMVLLEKSGLLLVAAENGRVHLVRADPADFVEVDSFKALEGKTWNHPVVIGDKLYVRNAQEAAAFELPLAVPSEPAGRL